MQLIQTAPGQVFAISTSNGCVLTQEGTPYSIELSKGQSHVLAKGEWMQIDDTTALVHQVSDTTIEVNVSLVGAGSLPGLNVFVTNLVSSIVGPGNATVELDNDTSTVTVAVSTSTTEVQLANVQTMLSRVLPKNMVVEVDPLPIEYIKAEFLESTGAQVIQTGIIPTTKTGFRCKVQETTASGMQCWYCGCQTSTNGYWLTSRSQNGGKLSIQVGANGVGLIPIEDNATDMSVVEAACNFYNSGTAGRLDNQSKITMSGAWTRDFTLFQAAYGTGTGYDPARPMRIFYFSLTEGNELVRDFVPVLDPDGVPVMYDNVNKAAFTNSGSGQFTVGMTVEQASKLSKLPVVEDGKLTISLPWEAQWTARVQNALSIASTKGWTITVQYRDPEVATTNIPVSFLESTGTQYINTGVTASSELTVSVVFEKTLYSPYQKLLGANGTTDGTAWVIYTQPTTFSYGSENINYGSITQNKKYTIKKDNEGLFLDGVKRAELPQVSFVSNKNLLLFALCRANGSVETGSFLRLYSLKMATSTEKKRQFSSAIDMHGAPCVYDTVSDQNFYNSSTGAFIAGFDTAEQALKLALLPDVTAETDAAKKSLTVSLPWEAQLVVTGVPAALQVAANRGWTITVQYRDPEADNAYYNKYAECTKKADMEAVNANYKADLTADGKWIYPLPKLADGNYVFSSVKISEIAIEELPLVSSGYFMFSGNKVIKRFTTRMPKMNWFDRTFHDTSLEVFDYDGEEFRPGSLQLGFNSCENFRTFNAVLGKKLANATLAFSECILDKPSILRIANSAIPSSSGIAFTIGMHIDFENDEEVLTALDTMTANGWKVIPQWNGTPTAQTASVWGLRRRPIYAKVIEIDGTKYLDWGHYFPTWESSGYQEFSSKEEAKEYFNINQPEEV